MTIDAKDVIFDYDAPLIISKGIILNDLDNLPSIIKHNPNIDSIFLKTSVRSYCPLFKCYNEDVIIKASLPEALLVLGKFLFETKDTCQSEHVMTLIPGDPPKIREHNRARVTIWSTHPAIGKTLIMPKKSGKHTIQDLRNVCTKHIANIRLSKKMTKRESS